MAGILDYFNDIAKVAYKTTPLGILNTASDIGGQVSEKASDYLGEQTMKKTGSPLAATGAYMLPFLAGMVAPGGKTKLAKTEFEAAQELAQQRAALPISEGGLGLPANNTAMDRAKAMGFDTKNPLYHGTKSDFSAFKEGRRSTYLTDEPKISDIYANSRNHEFYNANAEPNVLPLFLRGKKLEVTDAKLDKDGLMNHGYGFDNIAKAINSERNLNVMQDLKKSEYDFVKMNDMLDLGGVQTQYIVPTPSLIRSRFAAFDPFRRNEADILAGVAAAPVGLLAVDKDKKKKKNK